MKCRNQAQARWRTSFRDQVRFGAILLIIQFFTASAPLRAQALTQTGSDPFESVQRSLDAAVAEQLSLVLRLSPPVAASVLRPAADAQPGIGTYSPSSEDHARPQGVLSTAQHFQLLGVDAGRIFGEEGVPVALLQIVRVESNWKPLALSSKGAFGLWQLMPATARRYGLRVDSMRDDRADTRKSTRAAAQYLRDLHLRFGNWTLAVAAYNAGEDAIQTAIERGKSNVFGNLSRMKLLPAETRAYVPAVLGALDPLGAGPKLAPEPLSNGNHIATGHKLELHDLLHKTYIDVTHGTEKQRYAKSELFGFRACDEHAYRFASNFEYQILESKELYIYSQDSVFHGKGSHPIQDYYFSAGSNGSVLALTSQNLKQAFPDNHKFSDSLDATFGVSKSLAAYDKVHKMFKVNWLLIVSRE